MEIKFDCVRPNLIVDGNSIYVSVLRDPLIPFTEDVDEVITENIGELHVRESDFEIVRCNKIRKVSEKMVPLKDYIAVLKEEGLVKRIEGLITDYDSEMVGVGSHLIDAWTLWNSQNVDFNEIKRTKRFLADVGDYLRDLKEVFGITTLTEEYAKRQLEKRLSKLEEGVPERAASLWVIHGLATKESLDPIFGYGIAVARIELRSKNENDEVITKTRQDLIERLKVHDGAELSFDTPLLMDQAYELRKNKEKLIEKYGAVLDNPDWRRRLTTGR